jgi:hypothetical protein
MVALPPLLIVVAITAPPERTTADPPLKILAAEISEPEVAEAVWPLLTMMLMVAGLSGRSVGGAAMVPVSEFAHSAK